jgi:uncharacterized membrane protein YbjE (DUF340 family)
MKDKLLVSIIAGSAAGAIKDLIGWITIITKINNLTLWHYAGKIAYGHIPHSVAENIFSIFYELIIGTTLGYFILLNENKFCTKYTKILYVGICSIFWLFVRSFIVSFKVSELYHRGIISAIIGVGSSMIFGLVFALVSQWLMKKKS